MCNASLFHMSKSKRIGYTGEKLVGDYLGLERTGALGTQIYDLGSDSKYYGLVKLEIKTGKHVPKFFTNALAQILDHVSGDDIPAVITVPKGVGEKTLGEKAVVTMRLMDFKHLLDGLEMDEPKDIKITTESGKVFNISKGDVT